MSTLMIYLIRCYQYLTRSGGANPFWLNYSGCRSWPTCSEYAIQALERDGVIRGSVQVFSRIIHCHS